MILYYAIGGGLGHLTRMRSVLHTLGITDDVTVLTASQAVLDSRITGGHNVQLVPPELAERRAEYRAWLHNAINRIAPRSIFIDTFPAGIVGEFCDFVFPAATRLIHIARLLRWKEYGMVLNGQPPSFAQSWCVEPLAPEQEAFVQTHSQHVNVLELIDPPQQSNSYEVERIVATLSTNGPALWLVVHSGPAEEIEDLLAYARERAGLEGIQPRIVLISPIVISGVEQFDLYPANPLFPYAERIITACGFNAMRQLAPWRAKHWFVPMPRRYDDQFLRAAHVREQSTPLT